MADRIAKLRIDEDVVEDEIKLKASEIEVDCVSIKY